MSSPRIRLLAASMLALVLIAVGSLWFVLQPDQGSGVGAPETTEVPGATTTAEVAKSFGTTDPGSTTVLVERVDPKVEADIAASGRTEVLVVFDLQPTGTDEEKRAQIQSGIDAITASLPAGSWSIAGETPTVPVANLTIDSAALLTLQQRPGVQRVNSALHEFFPAEVTGELVQSDDLGVSATTSTMGAPTAWAAGFKGAGTTIAIIDTGVQTDHPYLMNGTVPKTIGEACFAAATGYTSPCPGGVPMGVNSASKVGAGAPCPVDITSGQKECDHGTHVAGIAAGGNGTGTSGIAPAASLISIQVFAYKYSTNRITATTEGIDAALQWLYNRRLDFPGLAVVNMSLGDSPTTPYTGTCDAGVNASTKLFVQQLLNIGIATVVASGNDGFTTGVSSPACLSNVVAVSALTSGPGSDQRASYANVGPQVNVFAPGTLNSSFPCNGTGVLQGTSMATPAVSGSIAILRQASVYDSVVLLENTGTDVAGFVPGPPSVKLNTAIIGLPGPTGSVSGVASGSQVAVSWTAGLPGSGTLSSYKVTAAPGGQSCTTSGLTCSVTGLDPTKSYVFTVVPTGTSGVGPGRSSAAIPMPNVPATPADYVPLTPARFLDTRSMATGARTFDGNDLGCGAVGQGLLNVRTLVVEGRAGIPSTGVDAVAVNVTVVSPTASNYVTIYPSGTPKPNASNINFVAGQNIPNMAIVKVGSDGKIAIYNESGLTQVIVDVVGWFPDGSDYTGVDPQRLLDTRSCSGCDTIDGLYEADGALAAQQTFLLPVVGRGTIPLTGVGAVALNVTVVAPTASNYLTVYPSGAAQPTASNLNFTAGQTIANMVIAKVGNDGKIAIFNNAGSTQVLVDVVGWFPSVSEYTGIVPQRFMDTRSCSGCDTIDGLYEGLGPLTPAEAYPLQITGRGSIPSSGVGS
ncbi:MAG: S8 family serine peptidase, partial [Actinomycetota bacterium]